MRFDSLAHQAYLTGTTASRLLRSLGCDSISINVASVVVVAWKHSILRLELSDRCDTDHSSCNARNLADIMNSTFTLRNRLDELRALATTSQSIAPLAPHSSSLSLLADALTDVLDEVEQDNDFGNMVVRSRGGAAARFHEEIGCGAAAAREHLQAVLRGMEALLRQKEALLCWSWVHRWRLKLLGCGQPS